MELEPNVMEKQWATILTKSIGRVRFSKLRELIGVYDVKNHFQI